MQREALSERPNSPRGTYSSNTLVGPVCVFVSVTQHLTSQILTERHSVVVHIKLDFSREFKLLLTTFRPSCVSLLQVRNTTITERKQSKSNQTKGKEFKNTNALNHKTIEKESNNRSSAGRK